MALRVFAIIPQRKRRSDTTQYVPDLRVAKAGWGLPVALLLVFPASTLQRKKPLQCHRFPRAREGLLARETISPADNLPKHQSGRAFTKRLLPQASSVASHPRCALSRSGTASFPVLPFQTDACHPFCALSALPSLQSVFENFLKRNFGIFCAIWRCEFLP